MMIKAPVADLDKLRKYEDYREGAMNPEVTIVLGTRNNDREDKKHLKDEQVLNTYRFRDDYKGRVLYPEGRDDVWTYEKNQAFMLGGIEANKTFKLVTPITEYMKEYITTTIDELLWLKDNGYEFTKNSDNTLTCVRKETSKPVVIKSYDNGEGSYSKAEMQEAKYEIFGIEPPKRSFHMSYSSPKTSTSYFEKPTTYSGMTWGSRADSSNWRSPSTSSDRLAWNKYPSTSKADADLNWRVKKNTPIMPLETDVSNTTEIPKMSTGLASIKL